MNTAEGFAMIDTNQMHRVHYACPVERPERVTWRDWLKVVGFYIAGTCAIAGAGLLLGYLVGSVL